MTSVWTDTAAGLRADPNLKILLSIHYICHYLALACIFLPLLTALRHFKFLRLIQIFIKQN